MPPPCQQRRVSCPSCEKKYAGVGGGVDDKRLPVILPCLCVFCKECALAEEAKAQQQVESEGQEHEVQQKRKEYTPTPCMKCQKPSAVPVADLKLDAVLMRQIASSDGGDDGSSKLKKAPQCDVCEEEDATKFCGDCTKIKLFCNGCFAAAHKPAKKRGHSAIPIEDHIAATPAAHTTGGRAAAAAAAGGGAEQPTMCHIHTDEALKFYCDDCNVLVCAMCAVTKHNGHALSPIADAVGVHRAFLEALVAEVVVSRNEAVAAANAIKVVRGELEGNREAALKVVEDDFNTKRALLTTMLQTNRQQRDALQALIKGAHDEKCDALSAQIDALDDIESNSGIALKLVDATLATATPVELLEMKQTFVGGLVQFKEHQVALKQCCVSKIDVVLDTSFEGKAAGILKMGTIDTGGSPVASVVVRTPLSPPQPRLQKQLCAAVRAGDVAAVRTLLAEEGADPAVAGDGAPTWPPMHLAAEKGHVDVVTALVASNADVNQAMTTNGCTPVYVAAEKGHVDVVTALVAHNADVNQAKTTDGSTPVYVASQHGHVDVVTALVAHNADVNQAKTTDGSTPVYVAAWKGHVDVVTALVAGNADVNQAKTTNGCTPVFVAAQHGHVDVVTALVASNADVNQARTDIGATPVYVAAQEGHGDVVTALVAGNAEVNQATTTNGTTPVYIAAQKGHIDVVTALVASNADVNQARKDGWTPLKKAKKNGHSAVVALLKQHGAV
eukprot:gene14311-biopygen31132